MPKYFDFMITLTNNTMKKILLFCCAMLMALAMQAQVINGRNFGIDGFAAYEGTSGTNWYHAGGTTGGEGGKVVKADNFAQLQAYLQSSNKYIILVDHDITTGIKCYVDNLNEGHLLDDQTGASGEETTYGERIMVASNKTLIGIADPTTGQAPLISHITFVMQCTHNVIIRNMRFTMYGVPILKAGENKIVAWRDGAQKEVGDPDCIGIQADATSAKVDAGSHIWIDHCEFFNGDAKDKDRYDGLLDCKNNIQWLTFSYNYFHDHEKSCLWGKGNSDIYDGCRTISCHHNYFHNIQGSRLPLQRGGKVHYMNNYQNNCSDGWDLRSQAVSYADACYFKDTKAPILPDGNEGATLNINTADGYGIIYDNCRRVIVSPFQTAISYVNPPARYDAEYDLASYSCVGTWLPTDVWSDYYVNSHDKAEDVPAICEKYSGAGKIEIYKTYSENIPEASSKEYSEATKTQETAPCYDAEGNKVAEPGGGGIDPGQQTYVSDPKITCEKNVVTITTSPSDATIYYTTDGTDPSKSNDVYTGPFLITANTTIKAIGIKEGLDDSDISSLDATYVTDVTPMVTEVVYSNGFSAFIKQPASASANGSIKAYYMQGDEAPTITSATIDGAVGYDLTAGVLTVSQGSNEVKYDVTLEAVAPQTFSSDVSSKSFDGTETWIKSGYDFDSSKGWRFAKAVEESSNRRISEGKTRIYFFVGPATKLSLINGGVSSARVVEVYVNGVKTNITSIAKSTSTTEITTSSTQNNLIAVISNQTNGDGGFTKYSATKATPSAISNVNANPNSNVTGAAKYVVNGRLVIEKDGKQYTIAGQQM